MLNTRFSGADKNVSRNSTALGRQTRRNHKGSRGIQSTHPNLRRNRCRNQSDFNLPKLKNVFHAEGLHRDLIETVLKIVKFVKVTKRVSIVKEHPADDKFIKCTQAAGSDYIVSVDKFLENFKLRIGLGLRQTAWFPRVLFERGQKAIQKAFCIRWGHMRNFLPLHPTYGRQSREFLKCYS
jgi:hypothetical protein